MPKLNVVNNPSGWSKQYRYDKAWILSFGAYGNLHLLVYARGIDEALEECAGWLSDNAPGWIMAFGSEEHQDLLKEACEERGLAWPEPEGADLEAYHEAYEQAEADLTYTESGFLTSYEWGISGEDLTPKEIADFHHGR